MLFLGVNIAYKFANHSSIREWGATRKQDRHKSRGFHQAGRGGRLRQEAVEVDIQKKGETDVKAYIVYRLDYIRLLSEPVGKLMERRRKDRVNNTEDLLKLAERIYPQSSPDSHLVITPE